MFPRQRQFAFSQTNRDTIDLIESKLKLIQDKIKETETQLAAEKRQLAVVIKKLARDSTVDDTELQMLLRKNLKNDLIRVSHQYKNKEHIINVILKDANMNVEQAAVIFSAHVDRQYLKIKKHYPDPNSNPSHTWGVEVIIPGNFRDQIVNSLNPVTQPDNQVAPAPGLR